MGRWAASRIDPVGAFLEATGGEDPEPLRWVLEGTYDLPGYELLPQHALTKRRVNELRAEREALERRLAEIAPRPRHARASRLVRYRHYLEAAGYTVIAPNGAPQ